MECALGMRVLDFMSRAVSPPSVIPTQTVIYNNLYYRFWIASSNDLYFGDGTLPQGPIHRGGVILGRYFFLDHIIYRPVPQLFFLAAGKSTVSAKEWSDITVETYIHGGGNVVEATGADALGDRLEPGVNANISKLATQVRRS